MLEGKDREEAIEWVNLLRSGKYDQGNSALRTDEGFCCLGVYCDILAPGEWKQKSDGEIKGFSEESDTNWVFDDGSEINELYYEPPWMDGSQVCKVADMNDKGKTFYQIADYIEQVYLRGESSDDVL